MSVKLTIPGSRLALVALTLGVAAASQALTINAQYDSSGATAFDAAGQADINSAIAMFQGLYTNNVTVNIHFQNMSSGLGQSSTQDTAESYQTYYNLLAANPNKSAIDVTALAHLPNQANNPLTQQNGVVMTTAEARAVGFTDSTTVVSTDSTIGLNEGLCFTTHTSPQAGKYDLFGVACHEIDEALGTSSWVGGGTGTFNGVNYGCAVTDLFRYDGSGNRSFTTSTGVHAYFSVDGTTLIDEYNQFGRTNGDWGDWVVHSTPQVQDWAGTPGVQVNYGPGETDLLDATGWNVKSVPEPCSMTLLGLGAAALLRRRFKKS